MWHDPDGRLQKAIDRYEEGDVAAARAMLRSLERQGVISPRIDLYLAHCHLDEDRPRAALRRYHRCVALSHSDASGWIGIALCHGRFGQLERALEVLQHAAALDPHREEIHCHLVHCHALIGAIDLAEAHARIAMNLDPTCPHVHRHLAVAYLVAGLPERALSAWREVLARDPAHPEMDVGMARCFAALGRRTEARRHYVRATRSAYGADAHAGLGDLAWLEGRLEEAVLQYRNAVDREPEHDEARMRLAETLTELGNPSEAWALLQPLRQAWEPLTEARACLDGEGPHDPEVAAVAARVLKASGRSARGFEVLRRVASHACTSAAAWTEVGRYLSECGRVDPAVRALRRALRCVQQDAGDDGGSASRLLARALAHRGRRRAAVRVLAGAVHRDPQRPELQLDLAAALLARGRIHAAERALLRGIDCVPDEPDLWAAAAELAFESGRRRLARERLRAALKRNPRHGQALALLVRWLLDQGEPARAVNAARAARRVLPVDHAVVKDHARALLLCRRAQEAALPLRSYVLAVPSDPDGYRLLARALAAVGDEAGARNQHRLGTLVGASS